MNASNSLRGRVVLRDAPPARRPARAIVGVLGCAGVAVGLARMIAQRRAERIPILGMRRPRLRRRSSGPAWALLALAAITAADLAWADRVRRERRGRLRSLESEWSRRSAFPQEAARMRGAGRAGFEPPADMRTPEALRPWRSDRSAASATG